MVDIPVIYYWIGIIVVGLIIEALTVSLTTIWFVIGAVFAGVLCVFNVNVYVQIFLFLIISIVLLYFTRPLAIKYFNKNIKSTNVNSLIGKEAVVTEEINNLKQTGKVKIGDIDWIARTESNNEIIEKNKIIKIVSVEGVKLIVQTIK